MTTHGMPRQERRRRIALWAVPIAALALVGGVSGAVLVVVSHLGAGAQHRVAATTVGRQSNRPTSDTTGLPPTPRPASSASTPGVAPGAAEHAVRPVLVTSDIGDGATVGVGEPIVLNLSPLPTDPTAFLKAVSVSVNGRPAHGAWFWEKPDKGLPAQAHYREQTYWPPDSAIEVRLPIGGLSAGRGLAYSGALSSISFRTGDAHISYVDAQTLQMRVTSNGRTVRTFPVSLGASETPTYNGTKIVMQKGEDEPGTDQLRPNGTVLMSGPHYTDDPVAWSVRITQSGEYVHAAPWNHGIGEHSTSNGCTNLHTDDAIWFYHFARLGDVVKYTDTDGTQMSPYDGLGDWNVPWGTWQQGGLLADR